MPVDATTRELVEQCRIRVTAGDVSAAFDLASAFISHVDDKDIDLNLAVIEVLAMLAAREGCIEADEFLANQWLELKPILDSRWRRKGFV